jgi:hypothetical protein
MGNAIRSRRVVASGNNSSVNIEVVDYYSDLPPANTVPYEFYWVNNSQGTAWLPGSLGGTYYPAGLYYSNGVNWEYIDVPYQATLVEVDAGLIEDKFVSPYTFTQANKWTTKEDVTNKSTDTNLGTSNTLYPTQNAVKEYVDNNINITGNLTVNIQNSGYVIESATSVYYTVTYPFTLDKWYLVGNTTGSILLAVKNNGVDMIGAGNAPTLSSAQRDYQTITGWTDNTVVEGDELEFIVSSASTLTQVTLNIKIII